ncbi:hypothetical protein H4582DRAFT_2056086 [Lactarius indigo]|nr:hypothetical protein H4582DRAFT_2056086 [Lactarius indigo]
MSHHQCCNCPQSKKTKTAHDEERKAHSLSPCPPALAKETDSDSDLEDDYGEDEWDPHASTKPSPLDGEALDEHWDPEDDTEEVSSEAFNDCMIQMLSDLQDNDPCDQDWKPRQEQKKVSTKNEGHRKAPPFGPDVTAKSAQSQHHPKHWHAMQSQSRLTSFDFTQSKHLPNEETQNTSSPQPSPTQSPPPSAFSPAPAPTPSVTALFNVASPMLLHTNILLLLDAYTPLPLPDTDTAQAESHSTFCNQGHKQWQHSSGLQHMLDLDDAGEAREGGGDTIQGFQVDDKEAVTNSKLMLGASAGGVDSAMPKVDASGRWQQARKLPGNGMKAMAPILHVVSVFLHTITKYMSSSLLKVLVDIGDI